MHSFLISIPIAISLWALMLLAVALAVALMARPRATAAPTADQPTADGPTAARSAAARSAAARSAAGRFLADRLFAAGRSAVAESAVAGSGAAESAVAGSGVAGSGVAGSDAAGSDAAGPGVGRSGVGRFGVGRSGVGRFGVGRSGGGRSGGGRVRGVRRVDAGLADRSVADDLRFAGEVAVAAERAAATAARGRAGWEAAERELDAAWAAYQEADAAARRTWAATAFPLMSRRRKLGDNADRERYLHHTATVACRQRELSIAQLNDVYAHRGWNPRLHPVVQESLLRNAIRENAFANYQKAQRRERAAWQEAETAAEALRALRAEAAAAFGRTTAEQPVASEFWWAEPWTTGELPVAA
jgi:hypothetical protein